MLTKIHDSEEAISVTSSNYIALLSLIEIFFVEVENAFCINLVDFHSKGWLAIAKLIPLSLFISLLLMPNEAFDNVKIEK